MIARALLALILVLGFALESRADVPVPTESHYVVARFPAGPTAVTVDVNELGGVQMANGAAAALEEFDTGSDGDVWSIDLSILAGYPIDCERRTFIVRFVPDAADCDAGATPLSCVELAVELGGPACLANPNMQISYVYTQTAVTALGITAAVIDFYNRRGTNPIKWREVRVAEDENFASPDSTYWEVYVYKVTQGAPHLACTVVTESDPGVSLPSVASCAGS